MGDIIAFKNSSSLQRQPRRQLDRADRERLESLGGNAIASLTAWKRGVPMEDRVRMARNMDRLFREYQLKPAHLDWETRFPTREAFGRDLHRMRLPEADGHKKRLVAHTSAWIWMLELITNACANRGEQVTLEALAERLTRGTRFHPVQKVQTRAEKLLYTINLWANEVDQEFGLLRTYRELAAVRAEYRKLHMRDYYEEKISDSGISSAAVRPSEYFGFTPQHLENLFHKPLGEYSDEDWDTLYTYFDGGQLYRDISRHREDIASWKASINPEQALFDTGVWLFADYAFMPRWFVGPYDYDRRHILSAYGDDYFHTQTMDPLLAHDTSPWDIACSYLVLFPNREMSRIVPYLMDFFEEASCLVPLTEDELSAPLEKYFTPTADAGEVVSKPLGARVEESFKSISQAWRDTANDLKNHPYFEWSAGRDTQIDDELARLTSD